MTTEGKTDSADPIATGPVVLIPPFSAGAQGDSRMRLRWCLRDGLVEELATKKVWSPYLLICVAAKLESEFYKEARRYLVPLHQYEQMLYFDYAGDNVVFATVVWHDDGYAKLRKHLMRKDSSGQYEHSILDAYEGGFVSFGYNVNSISESSSMPVAVEAGVFGKEPPKFLLKFVSCFYAKPLGRVECDFRRHCLGAALYRFWLSLVAVPLIWMLQGLIVAGMHIAGLRNVNYAPFRHPYTQKPNQIWADTNGSRWFSTQEGEPRSVFFMAVNPLVFVIMVGLWFGIGWVAGLGWKWTMVGAVLTFLALPFVLLPLAALLAVKLAKMVERYQEGRKEKETRRLAELRRGLEVLACDRFPERREELTFSIRWDRLKARVCRPYARQR